MADLMSAYYDQGPKAIAVFFLTEVAMDLICLATIVFTNLPMNLKTRYSITLKASIFTQNFTSTNS